jgi:uncharacterized protein DUF4386
VEVYAVHLERGAIMSRLRTVGLLYLVTHVTSVGAVILYGRLLTDPTAGTGLNVQVGALLEIILALAVIGTAVGLFPVLRPYGEGVALGYVGLRTLEAAVITVGVMPLMALPSPDAATLVALHNQTFLLGPGFVCGANTVLAAYLVHRSGLVPRFIPVLGLIGGPALFLISVAQLLHFVPQFSALAAAPALPVFAWELSLAVYLVVRGTSRMPAGNPVNAQLIG